MLLMNKRENFTSFMKHKNYLVRHRGMYVSSVNYANWWHEYEYANCNIGYA